MSFKDYTIGVLCSLVSALLILGCFTILGMETTIEIFTYNYFENFLELFIVLFVPMMVCEAFTIENPKELLIDLLVCIFTTGLTYLVYYKIWGILIFSGCYNFFGLLKALGIPYAVTLGIALTTSKKIAKS